MKKLLRLGLALGLSAVAMTQSAAACGGLYEVKRGESLSFIADRLYKDAKKWSVIYQSNIDKIGKNPNRVQAGHVYSLPCIDGKPTGLKPAKRTQRAAVQVSAPRETMDMAGVKLLTAGDFAPFTDQSLEAGGLITEVVASAMDQVSSSHGIYWVNDWSSHLEPLLSTAMLDVGFPWYRPDCDGGQANHFRCQNFHFSDPMFEMLILLFTDKERPMTYTTDADIAGKRLCRPEGYFTHDLEKNGRNWVSDGIITLVQPKQVSDCFELLAQGAVDAVALNEFTGRTAVKDLGLEDKVDVLQSKPIAIEGLYVIVHKEHPRAAQLMDLVNQGLSKLKASGGYQQIVDKHMSMIWSKL